MLCSPLLPLASLLPLLLPSFLCSPSSLWQRNLNLVQSVSTTQRVEAGTSLQVSTCAERKEKYIFCYQLSYHV